jgi:hypothetical protein
LALPVQRGHIGPRTDAIAHSRGGPDGRSTLAAPSVDERDVDLGVHNVSRTAMIVAMIAMATTGLPSLAMSVVPLAA